MAQNIAVVNNKPISKAREDAWVKELTKQGQADSPELRKQVRDRLIQNEILLQEAQRRGVAEKADVKFMLDVQRQNTLIQALLRDEVEKAPVTDAQIKTAYEQQKAKVGGKEYRAPISGRKETKPRLTEQVKKGAKFEELAKPSRTRFRRRGALIGRPDICKAIPDRDQLSRAKYDAPIQTQFGWHVIVLMTFGHAVSPVEQ